MFMSAKFVRTAIEFFVHSSSRIIVAALALTTFAYIPTHAAIRLHVGDPEVLMAVESPVVLRRKPQRFELVLTKESSGTGRNFSSIFSAAEKRHVYLVMKRFQVEVDPAVLYAVHLAHAPTKSQTNRKWLVGYINFYNSTSNDVFFSVDVTKTLRKITESHRSADKLALFLTPTGAAAPDSKVTIGQISLVMQ